MAWNRRRWAVAVFGTLVLLQSMVLLEPGAQAYFWSILEGSSTPQKSKLKFNRKNRSRATDCSRHFADFALRQPSTSNQSSSPFGNSIPLVYVWFCGDDDPTKPRQDSDHVVSNGTSLNLEAAKKRCGNTARYFQYTLGASLLHVPTVVVITDPLMVELFRIMYPADILAKLSVYNYSEYMDRKYWTINKLYEWNLDCCPGKQEPFEKLNVLNFFIFRSWMQRENTHLAAYAEGDVAVLVPPFLREGCQAELTWRDRWDKEREWRAFEYNAMAAMGTVYTLEVMNDFTDFNINLYKEEYIWIQKMFVEASFMHAINQMCTWYMYAMASLDSESLPWSDGAPWDLQYWRYPPDFKRIPKKMPRYDGTGMPYRNATLPPTKRLRICNGQFPVDDIVVDPDARFWYEGPTELAPTLRKRRIGSRYLMTEKKVILRNLHFQGQTKNDAKRLFEPIFKAHGCFNFTS